MFKKIFNNGYYPGAYSGYGPGYLNGPNAPPYPSTYGNFGGYAYQPPYYKKKHKHHKYKYHGKSSSSSSSSD